LLSAVFQYERAVDVRHQTGSMTTIPQRTSPGDKGLSDLPIHGQNHGGTSPQLRERNDISFHVSKPTTPRIGVIRRAASSLQDDSQQIRFSNRGTKTRL
jgi:hypothetical protein